MNSKKIGGILIIIGLLLGGSIWYFTNQLYTKSEMYGCFQNNQCLPIQNSISLSHVVTGIFSFLIALGFYLIFFTKSEEAIMDRLEANRNAQLQEERFALVLRALDPYEQKVLTAVKEQDGITQSTLRWRTEMSKAKLSYVLQELERRDLVKRFEKGKTLAVHLKSV